MAEVSWADELAAITVSNNADWNESHDVKDGEDPMDLDGCVISMQLRKDPHQSTTYLDLSSPLRGITIVDDSDEVPNAALNIYAPASVMQAIPLGTYYRDILIKRGEETLFAGRGTVEVVQGVTRP